MKRKIGSYAFWYSTTKANKNLIFIHIAYFAKKSLIVQLQLETGSLIIDHVLCQRLTCLLAVAFCFSSESITTHDLVLYISHCERAAQCLHPAEPELSPSCWSIKPPLRPSLTHWAWYCIARSYNCIFADFLLGCGWQLTLCFMQFSNFTFFIMQISRKQKFLAFTQS